MVEYITELQHFADVPLETLQELLSRLGVFQTGSTIFGGNLAETTDIDIVVPSQDIDTTFNELLSKGFRYIGADYANYDADNTRFLSLYGKYGCYYYNILIMGEDLWKRWKLATELAVRVYQEYPDFMRVKENRVRVFETFKTLNVSPK